MVSGGHGHGFCSVGKSFRGVDAYQQATHCEGELKKKKQEVYVECEKPVDGAQTKDQLCKLVAGKKK